jgi:hypothetical protein
VISFYTNALIAAASGESGWPRQFGDDLPVHHAHSHAYGHTDPDQHAGTQCNLHADLDTNRDGDAHSHTDGHVSGHADPHADTWAKRAGVGPGVQ